MSKIESDRQWPPERSVAEEIEYTIRERESQRQLMEEGIGGDYLDSLDPTLRPRIANLFTEEIEALRALDPTTATLEDIRAIRNDFLVRSHALNPHRNTE